MAPKIRILYVTDALMAGGIESQLVELVTRLDRAQFEPHILCLYGPTSRDIHFAECLRAQDIPVHLLDLGWGATDKLMAARRIVSAARTLRPDFIQAENYHANILTRAARPFLSPTRIIGTVRGIYTSRQLRYERLNYRACDHIVVSAPHLKRQLVEQAGVPPARIEVVPNSVDLDRFGAPADASLRTRLAPGARRLLVSVGRISKQKKMHLIAEGLGLLKREGKLPDDVRVVIVGPVEDATMQTQLDDAVQRHGLTQHLLQHPPTDRPEEYYHAADASILFTTLEGLSCAMLESLAAGRPVVISEEANRAGVIEDGRTGWVVPTGDIPAFAAALHTLFTLSDAGLARMQLAARDVAGGYAVDRMVQHYTLLYRIWHLGLPGSDALDPQLVADHA